jgi:hypothetical protein
MYNIIKKYIENDNWTSIIQLIEKGKITDINEPILYGNNLYHLACVKGKIKVINKLISLKKENKIILDTSLPNKDGFYGINLYYKYGGNDLSLLNNDEICDTNMYDESLIEYVVEMVDILDKLIDNMIDKKCLEITNYDNTKTHILYILCKKSIENIKYIDIIRKIYEYTKIDLLYVAISSIAINVIKMLVTFDFEKEVRNTNYYRTMLCQSVLVGNLDIVIIILEYLKYKYDDIEFFMLMNQYTKLYNERPIFISIYYNDYVMLSLLIDYIPESIKNNNQYMLSELDNLHDTYLHSLLYNYKNNVSKTLDETQIKIFTFFIQHTDLNFENYDGTTCSHLLFSTELWKTFMKVLEGREMDLLKLDKDNNNCYSYVSKTDENLMLEFTKTIKVPINLFNKQVNKQVNKQDNKQVNKQVNKQDNKQYNKQDNKNIKKYVNTDKENYGLFDNSHYSNFLYIKYLENTYNNLCVPTIKYDDNDRTTFLFKNELIKCDLNLTNYKLYTYISFLKKSFYSYSPSTIYWYDKDIYYIDDTLNKILNVKNNKRYIYIYIYRSWDEGAHANSLIYDKDLNEAWRFEPYGTSIMGKNDSGYYLDIFLKELLEKSFGKKIKYNDPDSFLTGINFQMVSGEDYNQTLGDPDGYCLAWSIWFVELVVSNPDKNVNNLIKEFLNKKEINEILSEKEGKQIESTSYYQDFIRIYAHKLDDEKNKILNKIGINKYNYYNYNRDTKLMEKVSEFFKI